MLEIFIRFDVTTTRTGLNALSNRLLELFLAFDEKSRDEKAGNVSQHFCNHIQRSALIALRNEDEGILGEIIAVLQDFGTQAADLGLEDATCEVANALREMGTRSADKGLEVATINVAGALGNLGFQAVDKGQESLTWRVTDALGEVGTHSADKGLLGATEIVADALGEMGSRTADKGLKGETERAVHALYRLGQKKSGQNAAAKSLAKLISRYNKTIIESIKIFESELNSGMNNIKK